MIVKIQVRDAAGAFQYRDANVSEFAQVSLRQIIDDGLGGSERDGWWWMRQWLGSVCIQQAERYSGTPEVADRWYRRYQAIRGIE